MSFRKKNWVLGASILAASTLIAGCGGSDEMETDGGTVVVPPVVVPPVVVPPAATPLNIIALPVGHAIPSDIDKSFVLMAGMSHKAAGVRFWCDADAGADGCTVTIAPGDGADRATFDEDMGSVTAVALDATGYQAFMNLSAALLDEDTPATLRTDGSELTPLVLGDRSLLQLGAYTFTIDDLLPENDPDRIETPDVNEEAGGVTSSLTTHDQPDVGSTEPVTGINDITVSVDVTIVPEADSVSDAVDTTPNTDGYAGGVTGMGTITPRSVTYVVETMWENNPAEQWMIALMGEEVASDSTAFWTHELDEVHPQAEGGRTVHLDFRSDLDLWASRSATLLYRGTPLAVGPGTGAEGQPTTVAWDDVVLAGGEVIDQGERNFDEAEAGEFKGIPGTFTCNDVNTNNICRINNHGGQLGVSTGDQLIFTPAAGARVFVDDTDWLAAGVWITIPEDAEQGDYAIGAFVYGSEPFVTTTPGDITGTASYSGQAFGRFAERDGDNMETGNFTAGATFMADFEVEGATHRDDLWQHGGCHSQR